MQRVILSACALVIAMSSLCAVASAGTFTYFRVDPSDDHWTDGMETIVEQNISWVGAKHSYTFNTAGAVANFQEGPISALGVDPYVIVSGNTDGDPIFHVHETIQNASGATWGGWEVDLGGSATFDVTAAPFSDKFLTYSLAGGDQTLTFHAPQAVASGQSVSLDFDISVPTTGMFSFTLTQTAIPEPATLSLLVAGGLALLRRSRK
jgi:hypothetical protein